jgi:hypothetical protein
MELSQIERALIVASLEAQRLRNLDNIPDEGHADSKAVKDAVMYHRSLTALLKRFRTEA